MDVDLPIDDPERGVRVGSYVGFLLGVLGLFAWVVGQPLLIPSVGPSAFALATLPENESNLPKRVLAGQFIGAGVGLVAFFVVVGPGRVTSKLIPRWLVAFFVVVGHSVSLAHVQPLTLSGLRYVAAPFVAVILTTILMYLPDLAHPPAYAAALLMAHGLLRSRAQIAAFAAAVLLLVAVHELIGRRLDIWDLPYPRERSDDE